MQIAEKLLPQGQLNLLKLALSLKSYTPLIQAHSEIANEVLSGHECEEETFVQIGNNIICNLSILEEEINLQKTENVIVELFSFDHIYPGSENNSLTVILYGQIGTRTLNNYHTKLKDLADKKAVKYVIRNYVKIIIY